MVTTVPVGPADALLDSPCVRGFPAVGAAFMVVALSTPLSAQAARTLAANSFEACFIDPAARRGYLDSLDAYVESFR